MDPKLIPILCMVGVISGMLTPVFGVIASFFAGGVQLAVDPNGPKSAWFFGICLVITILFGLIAWACLITTVGCIVVGIGMLCFEILSREL